MKLAEAEVLADRILAAINVPMVDERDIPVRLDSPLLVADRQRVISDLNGLRHDHASFHRAGAEICIPCSRLTNNLLRTGRLYGVQP